MAESEGSSRRLRVRFISHLFPQAEEPVKGVFVRELAVALQPLAALSVVAPVSYLPWVRRRAGVPARTVEGGLPVVHPRYLALPRLLFAHRWRPFARALQASAWPRPEVLHAHWAYPDAFATQRVPAYRGVPLVCTVHGHSGLGYFAPERERCFARQALQAATHLIAVSDELRDELVQREGIPAHRVSVLHNGYSEEKFAPQPKAQARLQLNLPASVPIILTVARLSPEKGLDLLLSALQAPGLENAQLYLLGGGPLEAELRRQIVAGGLADRVHLVGPVAHHALPAWYAAADLFCLPSLNEGCPVVVQEALACGLPVVAAAVGALPQLLRHPACGLLFPRRDEAQLAASLRAGLQRCWDYAAIATHGRAFTWAKVAAQTMALYRQVLQDHHL